SAGSATRRWLRSRRTSTRGWPSTTPAARTKAAGASARRRWPRFLTPSPWRVTRFLDSHWRRPKRNGPSVSSSADFYSSCTSSYLCSCSAFFGVLGGDCGDRNWLERPAQLRLHARLELADALAGQAELLADVGEGGLVAVGEEPEVDDGALALVERLPEVV